MRVTLQIYWSEDGVVPAEKLLLQHRGTATKLHLHDVQTRGEEGHKQQQRTYCISISACQKTTAAGCIAPRLQQPSAGLLTFEKTLHMVGPVRATPSHYIYTIY